MPTWWNRPSVADDERDPHAGGPSIPPPSLARLGSAALFLGLWVPSVALAIVWATAGSGTPIVFALRHAGCEELDASAVAVVLAPPLPYLFALAALGLGLVARSPRAALPNVIRRSLMRAWLVAGLGLTTSAGVALYAENGTALDPVDGVHISLWIATWAWWSVTTSSLAVLLALRGHAAVAASAVRSRALAGTLLATGVLSLLVASLAVAPRASRAALGMGSLPVIDTVASETESLVLSLGAGASAPDGSTIALGPATTEGGWDDDDAIEPNEDRYTFEECMEALFKEEATGVRMQRAFIKGTVEQLQARFADLDAADVAVEASLDICLDEPRRAGNLGGMLQDAATKRAISRRRRLATVRRNEAEVGMRLGASVDVVRQLLTRDRLLCLIEGLEPSDQELLLAELAGEGPKEIAERTGRAVEATKKALQRARARARDRAPECDELP